MSHALLNGLVLHRRAYRETSFIVDFFTRERGRVAAVCRGVRGKAAAKNEKRSLLQPFQPLQLTLTGKHELKTLGHVESTTNTLQFTGDVLFSAFYLNELLERVMPKEVVYEDIFDLYLASLIRLAQHEPVEIVLREFEMQFIQSLGYGFSWRTDFKTDQPLEPEARYEFLLEHGFCATPNLFSSLNVFTGQSLLDAVNANWNPMSLRAAKRCLRMALRPLIGEKPLKSRELFSARADKQVNTSVM